MAISTRKKNLIIADWKTGAYTTYSQLARKYKISDKTAKKIVINIDKIFYERKKTQSKNKRGYIYLIRAGNTNNYKIGITSGRLEKRLSTIQGSNHLLLEIVDYVYCSNINTKEKNLHNLFKKYNTHREWFLFDDVLEVKIQFENYRKLTVLEQGF